MSLLCPRLVGIPLPLPLDQREHLSQLLRQCLAFLRLDQELGRTAQHIEEVVAGRYWAYIFVVRRGSWAAIGRL